MEAHMAAARPPTHHHHSHQQQKAANLARTFTKLLRRKRSDSAAAAAPKDPDAPASVPADDYDASMDATTTAPTMPSLSKLKLSGNLTAAYTLDAFFRNAAEKKSAASSPGAAAADSLLATLFAGVSAVKAAYAQLQLAQHPYDAEAIQAADAAVVAELTRLSDTKRRFLKDPAGAARDLAAAGNTALSATRRSSDICSRRTNYHTTATSAPTPRRCWPTTPRSTVPSAPSLQSSTMSGAWSCAANLATPPRRWTNSTSPASTRPGPGARREAGPIFLLVNAPLDAGIEVGFCRRGTWRERGKRRERTDWMPANGVLYVHQRHEVGQMALGQASRREGRGLVVLQHGGTAEQSPRPGEMEANG